jgi:hypothetical protein
LRRPQSSLLLGARLTAGFELDDLRGARQRCHDDLHRMRMHRDSSRLSGADGALGCQREPWAMAGMWIGASFLGSRVEKDKLKLNAFCSEIE